MKKLISIIAAVVLALSLFSCKGAVGPAGPAGASAETGLYSMSFQQGTNAFSGCYDSRIREDYATVNYGGETVSYAGAQAGVKKRFIIDFYPTGVPAGAVVEKATISMQAADIYGSAPTLVMYEIKKLWFEMQVTWNQYSTGNSWTAPGGDFTATAASNAVSVSQADTWYTWTVNKELIQEKIDTGVTQGFIVVATDETGDREANIKTSEYGTVAERPVLTIYYTLP
jgi:hypothetical protein